MLHRLLVRFECVSDRQLLAFTVLWVIVGGLLLQLIILPFAIPSVHGGHGLIADLDSLGYHAIAIEQSKRILEQGWGAWELRPDGGLPTGGQFPAGPASALYALTYPEPWVALPLNGIVFGIAVTAVRRVLTVLFDSPGVALAGISPFFLFPSFVPIWGQLQKDLSTGAGLSLVLCALVLASQKGDKAAKLRWLVMSAGAGMGLVWLARPYGVVVVAAATMAFAALALPARRCGRARLSAVTIVVVLFTVAGIEPWQLSGTLPPGQIPAPATVTASETTSAAASRRPSISFPRTREIDASLPRYAACAPVATGAIVDKLLFSMCTVREGFIHGGGGQDATSGYDYTVRLRSVQDFIAYAPRAVGFVVLEPGPSRWGTENSPIGRLGGFFVPIEMVVAYGAFVLAVIFGWRHLMRLEVWAVVAFCVAYGASFVYATPQLGTLYRMRAFAFAIIVGTALAVALSRVTAQEDDPTSHEFSTHRQL